MADPATNPSVAISALRVQVLQRKTGVPAMVKNSTGLVLFNALRSRYLPIATFDLNRLDMEGPTQVSGTLTKVKYIPQEHSIYREPLELTYHRYHISVLNDLILTPPAEGWVSVEAVRLAIYAQGYRVVAEDLDLTKSVVRPNGSVTLYPSKTSWLFSPDGSYDSAALPQLGDLMPNLTTQDFDHSPHLHQAIAVDELSGFEVVPPLSLSDDIVNDTLSGFNAVGGN